MPRVRGALCQASRDLFAGGKADTLSLALKVIVRRFGQEYMNGESRVDVLPAPLAASTSRLRLGRTSVDTGAARGFRCVPALQIFDFKNIGTRFSHGGSDVRLRSLIGRLGESVRMSPPQIRRALRTVI